MAIRIILVQLFLWAGLYGTAQGIKEDKVANEADWAYDIGDYVLAIELYETLVEYDSTNAFYLYRAGLCYVHSFAEQDKALKYLERAAQISSEIPDVFYLLARAYHVANKFDEAIFMYQKFNKLLEGNPLQYELDSIIQTEIANCNYGKLMKYNPVDVIIENLGENINTPFPEYAPVTVSDESKIYFTSRREGSTGGRFDQNQEFFEDIYESNLLKESAKRDTSSVKQFVSLLTKMEYSPAERVSSNINSSIHDATIGISDDDKRLYIYHNYDLWESNYINEKWTKLKKMNSPVTSTTFTPSLSVSGDEKTMYLVSDKKGGYGGTDIYVSTRDENGNWSPLKNLGPTVNTVYNEDGPYIDPDGVTLYFSSQGHSSMGGFDLFKSKFQNGAWTIPQNMGYPINSGGDDIFFMMTPVHNRGYYSSDRSGGFGNMDIYRITFADERIPLAEVKGLVLKGDSLIPANSLVYVYDSTKTKIISEFKSDPFTGKYLVMIPHGKDYQVEVQTDDFVPYVKSFDIPERVKYFQFYQEIHHVHLKDQEGNIIGQKIAVYNAYQDDIKKDSVPAGSDTVFADGFENITKQIRSKSIESRNQNIEPGIIRKEEIRESSEVLYYIPQDSLKTLIEKDTVVAKQYKMNIRKSDVKTLKPKVLKSVDIKSEASLYLPLPVLENKDPITGEEVEEETTENEVLEKTVAEENNGRPNIDLSPFNSVVRFGFDKYILEPLEQEKVDNIYKLLIANDDLKIAVIGHTDSQGSADYNLILSSRRARRIANYLIKKGVSSSRISIRGKGEEQPIAPNKNVDGTDNIQGRQLNRRVEFKKL